MENKMLIDFSRSKVMDKIFTEFMFFVSSIVLASVFLGGYIQTIQPLDKLTLIILSSISLMCMVFTEIILIKKMKKVF